MQVEKIETNKNLDELSGSQKNDLFGNIIRGKDVTETIETSRGNFKIKFPRAKDLEAIGRILAYRLNGLSVQSMDPAVYNLMQQIASLDVVVLEGPAWYENAKKDGYFSTWGDIPIQSFIQEVYDKMYTFRDKVQKQLEKGKDKTNTGMDATGSNDVSDGAGLFEGMSGKT